MAGGGGDGGSPRPPGPLLLQESQGSSQDSGWKHCLNESFTVYYGHCDITINPIFPKPPWFAEVGCSLLHLVNVHVAGCSARPPTGSMTQSPGSHAGQSRRAEPAWGKQGRLPAGGGAGASAGAGLHRWIARCKGRKRGGEKGFQAGELAMGEAGQRRAPLSL